MRTLKTKIAVIFGLVAVSSAASIKLYQNSQEFKASLYDPNINCVDIDGQCTVTGADTVDCSGTESAYSTILTAYNATAPSGTVLVCPGTYDGGVSASVLTINKPITLLGAQANVDPIAGGRAGGESIIDKNLPIRIQSSDVEINGFEFEDYNESTSSDGEYAISVNTPINSTDSNITIAYNYLHDNTSTENSDSAILVGPTYGSGTFTSATLDNVIITKNLIEQNNEGRGITFSDQSDEPTTFDNFEISYNDISTPYNRGIHTDFSQSSSAMNNPTISDNTVKNAGMGGVNMYNLYNATFENNIIEDNKCLGASLGMQNSSISGNTFQNNGGDIQTTLALTECGDNSHAYYDLDIWGDTYTMFASNNITIEENDFHYNQNTHTSGNPENAIRIQGRLGEAETWPGGTHNDADATTITVNNNNFYNAEAQSDAKSLVNDSSLGTLDAEENYFDSATGPKFTDLSGKIDVCEFFDAAYPGGSLAGMIGICSPISCVDADGTCSYDNVNQKCLSDPTLGDPVGENSTVQDAVSNAKSGDTIYICDGTYNESVYIDKKVNLIGESQDGVILHTPTDTPTIQIDASGNSSADPLLIENMTIHADANIGSGAKGIAILDTGTLDTLEYLKLNNLKLLGTSHTYPPLEYLFYIDFETSVNGLVVDNSTFKDSYHGFIALNHASPNNSTLNNVTISNSTFENNIAKGLYFEKLSNATFDNITVTNNGDISKAASWGSDWLHGLDITLKYGDYENITIQNSSFTGNGLGSKNGSAIAIKARGTGNDTDYAADPASLDNLTITNVSISGNESGIFFGEPGKANLSPTNITIEDSNIENNTSTWATDPGINRAITNYLDGVEITAMGNWWGHLTGPVDNSDDRTSGGNYNPDTLNGGSAQGGKVSDNVNYCSWLVAAYPSTEKLYSGSCCSYAPDADGDGSNSCDDCDDNNANRCPTKSEVCNDGIDNNCNGQVDEMCSSGSGGSGQSSRTGNPVSTRTDGGDDDDSNDDSNDTVAIKEKEPKEKVFATVEEGCGNGVLENSEKCDDGNKKDGDGCNRFCGIEYIAKEEIEEFTSEPQPQPENIAMTEPTNPSEPNFSEPIPSTQPNNEDLNEGEEVLKTAAPVDINTTTESSSDAKEEISLIQKRETLEKDFKQVCEYNADLDEAEFLENFPNFKNKNEDIEKALELFRLGFFSKKTTEESLELQDEITRAEAVKWILNYHACVDCLHPNEETIARYEDKNFYTDLNKDHPYYYCITAATDLGIIDGYTTGENAGKYLPDEPITQAEIYKILLDNMSLDIKEPESPEPWYLNYIKKIEKDKVFSEGFIEASKKMTQEDLIEIIYSFMKRYKNFILEGKNISLHDADSDGLSDYWEIENFGSIEKTNLAGDEDADDLQNLDEYINRTDPNQKDTDRDGLNDYSEIKNHKTDPLKKDTDKDGIDDGSEAQETNTNPLKSDSDQDSYSDQIEISLGTDPLDQDDYPKDENGDGVADIWVDKYFEGKLSLKEEETLGNRDSDQDGLSDLLEYYHGTNPNVIDTDNDGYSDSEEVLDFNTNPLNAKKIPYSKIISITNWDNEEVSASAMPVFRGYAPKNAKVTIYNRADAELEKLAETVSSDIDGKFAVLSAKELQEGNYKIVARAEKDGELLSQSPTLSITIDPSLKEETPNKPEIQEFEGNFFEGDSGIEIDSNNPKIYANTTSGSQVYATWKSSISSSSVIADSADGEFTITPPQSLEKGEHEVLIYSEKDGLKSEVIRIPFTVTKEKVTEDIMEESEGFNIVAFLLKNIYNISIGLGVLILLITLLYIYKNIGNKEEIITTDVDDDEKEADLDTKQEQEEVLEEQEPAKEYPEEEVKPKTIPEEIEKPKEEPREEEKTIEEKAQEQEDLDDNLEI